jgi:hypothetical protein
MTNDTAQILASCLDAIEQGQSLEECVAWHPDQRLILNELLPVAQTLRSAPATVPSLDFRIDARQRLLARLPPRRRQRAPWPTNRVTLLRAAILLLLALALTTSVVTASAQALPNDMLYPVKRTIEQTQLALAADNVHRSELQLAFAAERLKEVERLIDTGREADTAVAVDDFADQMQSVVSTVQAMPDTIERAGLLAHIVESVKSSNAVLSAAQARLPESAQGAIARARTMLADRANDALHPASSLPLPAASTTPDRLPQRQRTPIMPIIVPTAMRSMPATRLPLTLHPTPWPPTHSVAPRPTEVMNAWPTRQSPRATSAPPVSPNYVLPHWPTPVRQPVWPGHRR